MLEIISIKNSNNIWHLSKIMINPDHISIVAEASEVNSLFQEGKINIGLNSKVMFSRLSMRTVSGFQDIIAVGSPTEILEKINKTTKRLLKG